MSSFWLRRGQINSCLPLGQKNHVEIVSSELDPNANWPFGEIGGIVSTGVVCPPSLPPSFTVMCARW